MCFLTSVLVNFVKYLFKVCNIFLLSLIILKFSWTEAVAQRCTIKKVFLEILQNSNENTCASVSFLIKLQASGRSLFIKKEALAQVFSCEIWEIFKNTFSYRTPLVAASKWRTILFSVLILLEKKDLKVIQNSLVFVIVFQSCARFLKLITQFRPFSWFFMIFKVLRNKRIVVFICLNGANASSVDWNIVKKFFKWQVRLWNLVLECFVERDLIMLFSATIKTVLALPLAKVFLKTEKNTFVVAWDTWFIDIRFHKALFAKIKSIVEGNKPLKQVCFKINSFHRSHSFWFHIEISN